MEPPPPPRLLSLLNGRRVLGALRGISPRGMLRAICVTPGFLRRHSAERAHNLIALRASSAACVSCSRVGGRSKRRILAIARAFSRFALRFARISSCCKSLILTAIKATTTSTTAIAIPTSRPPPTTIPRVTWIGSRQLNRRMSRSLTSVPPEAPAAPTTAAGSTRRSRRRESGRRQPQRTAPRSSSSTACPSCRRAPGTNP